MDSKALSLIIAFAALAIILNTVRIPTVFWPGFFYRLWEIPITVAFLLFGVTVGISVGILNVLVQIILFPIPAGIVAYPWGMIAILSMFIGIYLAMKINDSSKLQFGLLSLKPLVYFTLLGLITRTLIMPFVDFAMYKSFLPLALSRTFPESYVLAAIPASITFNIIVALYTIPISYIIAKKISKNLKVGKIFYKS